MSHTLLLLLIFYRHFQSLLLAFAEGRFVHHGNLRGAIQSHTTRMGSFSYRTAASRRWNLDGASVIASQHRDFRGRCSRNIHSREPCMASAVARMLRCNKHALHSLRCRCIAFIAQTPGAMRTILIREQSATRQDCIGAAHMDDVDAYRMRTVCTAGVNSPHGPPPRLSGRSHGHKMPKCPCFPQIGAAS